MSRTLLNPKIDFVFKKIFGSEKHPQVLISLLNAIIKPKSPIETVEIKNSEIEKDFIEDKFSRLDIKAKTGQGEWINVEIQLKNEYNMIKRSLYYWSKMYEEQLVEGEDYDKLQRTICINILNFKYLKTEKFHSGYRLKDIESHEELTDLEEIHFIEIPKLQEIKEEADVTDMLMAWVEFLKDPESEVVRSLEKHNPYIREAKDELYRLSNDAQERERYNAREKALKDKNSALKTAMEKGIEKGIEQGIEQGELKARIEVAKKLISIGVEVEQIVKATSLMREEIENLRD